MFGKSKPGFWWAGPAAGALVSTIVTVIMVTWEWIENPGGIFRSELGTHWQFVLDTGISWFVPTFIYVTAIVATSQLAVRLLTKYRNRGSS